MSGVLFTFCCLFVLLQDGRALKGFKHWFTLAAHGTRGYHARVRCGSFGLAIFTDLLQTTVLLLEAVRVRQNYALAEDLMCAKCIGPHRTAYMKSCVLSEQMS